ncbi:MAG: DUF3800 domain-containing protein [Candidatus Yanofskybacteria bacterium]|nr:DUF3800 domain-containing protein [Candidatus Yanofskybacteria bacterium]
MPYILLDESGDLGFSFRKGSSKFFIVTIIFTESKRNLEKIARRVHKTLRKKFKKVGVLHAYKEASITRQRLLKDLAKTDCGILLVILNKKKVFTKLQDEKSVLYNYVTNILLERLMNKKPIPIDKPIILIAAQRETNKFLNENFKSYLSKQINNNHKISLKVEIATPAEEKSLQVVDFASWAIFRKYEFGDDSYYNLVKVRIIEEASLFP